MIAGQKLNTSEGTQVLLFPLEYMNISQDEGGSTSHGGSLNMDFLGWGPNGRILRCPYYAPCNMTCVYHNENAWYNVWDSDNPVYCADGITRNISLMVIHDNTLPPLGTKVKQGDNVKIHMYISSVTGSIKVYASKGSTGAYKPQNLKATWKGTGHHYADLFQNADAGTYNVFVYGIFTGSGAVYEEP